ncbi:MAG TPA: hypothetical protein VFL42_11805 [Terriglobales bacterium]|nr:hypothetical protein [Terriglobales bacterium]
MTTHTPPMERVQIDQILESAVVLSWKELLQKSHHGVVEVEYGTAPEPSLQYLKIWLARKRGNWDLICEYWIRSGASIIPAVGLTFSNGYHSARLAQMLKDVMHHHDGRPDSLSGETSVGLIVIQSPTENEIQKADNCMKLVYQQIGLGLAQATGSAA